VHAHLRAGAKNCHARLVACVFELLYHLCVSEVR
jgi:hypothetical protein